MPLVEKICTCFCVCLCMTVKVVSVSISLCLAIGCCIYLALWKYNMCSLTPDCPNVQKFRVHVQITRSNTWMLHSCVSHGVWECMCLNTCTFMRVLKFVRSVTRVHVCVCICTFKSSFTHLFFHQPVFIHMLCVCMYVYVYIYLHAHIQTHWSLNRHHVATRRCNLSNGVARRKSSTRCNTCQKVQQFSFHKIASFGAWHHVATGCNNFLNCAATMHVLNTMQHVQHSATISTTPCDYLSHFLQISMRVCSHSANPRCVLDGTCRGPVTVYKPEYILGKLCSIWLNSISVLYVCRQKNIIPKHPKYCRTCAKETWQIRSNIAMFASIFEVLFVPYVCA